jgi:hypothetical protein
MEVSSPGVLRETGATGGTSCSLATAASNVRNEKLARRAAGALYNITAVVLIA